MTSPLPLCAPPRPVRHRPRMRTPPGATDCHVHTFGPAARFPPSPSRTFDVPDASPERLFELLQALGLQRVVLVQPTTYGADNARQLEAATASPLAARVVVASPGEPDLRNLRAWRARGARGLRHVVRNRADLEALPALSRLAADLDWCVQLFAPPPAAPPWPEVDGLRAELPSRLVVEHFGSVAPDRGVDQPAFRSLRRLLDGGDCWVKLSGAYRLSRGPAPWADLAPFASALAAARPDRLVWGSDWPHVNFDGDMPDDAAVLDALQAWLPSEIVRAAVLASNAAELFDFPDAPGADGGRSGG